MADLILKMKSAEIDDILDEIDKNEEKIQTSNTKHEDTRHKVLWDEIITKMQSGDTNYIKNLITSKDININASNPENGMTLLHYAIVIGNYDLVKAQVILEQIQILRIMMEMMHLNMHKIWSI